MNKAALIESLMSTFVEEVAEHVRSFNRDLLALEGGQGDPAPLLQSLFRTAHNMKGASRAVDVGLIESACHRLEDILARAARRRPAPRRASAFKLLFATADAIQDAGARPQGEAASRGSPLGRRLASGVSRHRAPCRRARPAGGRALRRRAPPRRRPCPRGRRRASAATATRCA